MEHFTTITQYDQQYKSLDGFANNRSACGFFSLVSAKDFLDGNNPTQERYLKVLDSSIANFVASGITQHLTFDELLGFVNSGANPSQVEGTSPELLKLYSPETTIFNRDQPASIIFLKNSKFIVVHVSPEKGYYVRDCHEMDQYLFPDYNSTINHLNKIYQFDKEVVIDGYAIPEFSNIEYIRLTEPIGLNLINNMELPQNQPVETEDINLVDQSDMDADLKLAMELQQKFYSEITHDSINGL